MNLNNDNFSNKNFELQPCPDCPYPMNVISNRIGPKDNHERIAITCRECGESWTEMILVGDNDEIR
jgi:RNase P subunit RPR2